MLMLFSARFDLKGHHDRGSETALALQMVYIVNELTTREEIQKRDVDKVWPETIWSGNVAQ